MKIIDKVTATGADDNTDFEFLLDTFTNYPYVEWGILISKNAMGTSRFPSQKWLDEMYHEHPKANFSCHVCGTWVRDLCYNGNIDFAKYIQLNLFQRIQLNFHSIVHKIDHKKFVNALKQFPSFQFIFQLDNVNNDILKIAKDAGINAVPLFDTSGGAGILPNNWPLANGYCGYAGGLSPDNIDEQIEKINKVSGDNIIWIDAETHLRSNNDDDFFDETKVLIFLEKSKKYCMKD